MQKMQNRRKEVRSEIPLLKPELGRDSPLPGTLTPAAAGAPSAGGVGGGGVTKKKPKKKK